MGHTLLPLLLLMLLPLLLPMLLPLLLHMLLPLLLDTPESLPPQLFTPTPDTTLESERLRLSLRLMLTLLDRLLLDSLMPPHMLMLFPPTPPDTTPMLLPPTPPDMDMDILAMLVLDMLLVATLVPSMVKLNLTGTS